MSPGKPLPKRSDPRVSTPSVTVNWRTLYQIGGAAAGLTVLVGLLEIAITFLPGGNETYTTAQEWFALLQENAWMGLRNLGLINMVLNALAVPIFFALYGSQRHVNHTVTALALLFAMIGVAVFYATNRALPMLALSHQYALTTDNGDRVILQAAGEAMLAVGKSHTPGTFLAFVLAEVSGLVMSGVMLQSHHFGSVTAYAGLLGFGCLLIFEILASFVPSLSAISMSIAIVGGLLNLTWSTLIARRLLQFARAGDAG